MESYKRSPNNAKSERESMTVEKLSNNRDQLLEDLAKNRLYDSFEVCEILRISLPTLRRAMKLGRVNTVYVGRSLRIRAEELQRLIEAQNTLSVKEAAKLLNVCLDKVRTLIKEETLKAERLTALGPWRIRFEEVEKFTKGTK